MIFLSTFVISCEWVFEKTIKSQIIDFKSYIRDHVSTQAQTSKTYIKLIIHFYQGQGEPVFLLQGHSFLHPC